MRSQMDAVTLNLNPIIEVTEERQLFNPCGMKCSDWHTRKSGNPYTKNQKTSGITTQYFDTL